MLEYLRKKGYANPEEVMESTLSPRNGDTTESFEIEGLKTTLENQEKEMADLREMLRDKQDYLEGIKDDLERLGNLLCDILDTDHCQYTIAKATEMLELLDILIDEA
ncbi:MAG: hypothetical protein Q9183_006819 [Haloplaca sp. 2 TL-2023]